MTNSTEETNARERTCRYCGGNTFRLVNIGGYVDAVCSECDTPHGNGFEEIDDDE